MTFGSLPGLVLSGARCRDRVDHGLLPGGAFEKASEQPGSWRGGRGRQRAAGCCTGQGVEFDKIRNHATFSGRNRVRGADSDMCTPVTKIAIVKIHGWGS